MFVCFIHEVSSFLCVCVVTCLYCYSERERERKVVSGF